MNKFKPALFRQKLKFCISFYREIISDTTNIAPHSAHWIFARNCKAGGDGRLHQIGTVVSDCCSTAHSNCIKVEKILKGSLDSIPSPSPWVEIQIRSWKVCLRCKGKTFLGIVNKLLKTKIFLPSPSNVLPYYLK